MSKNINKDLIDSIKTIFEEVKSAYSQKEVSILYISTFGEAPLDEEIKFIFQKSKEVNIQRIQKFFKDKMEQFNETDLHILELFRALDKDTKCFITSQDVVEAWNECKINFSLEQVIECFNLVTTEEKVLDYFTFRNLYKKSLNM